jgi:hypothetical protein
MYVIVPSSNLGSSISLFPTSAYHSNAFRFTGKLFEILCSMSGIEVAGLILGSIPLLISALEHYAEGVHTIKHGEITNMT